MDTEVEVEVEQWQEEDDWKLWHETTLQLFHDVREFFCEYIVFPSWHESVAVTLWVLHTHLIDRFDTTPRLVIKAPEKQSGKTRVLDVLELVVHNAEPASSMSVSTFFRTISAGNCTIIQDEYDAIFSDGTYEELRGAYNAGWERGKPFKRSEKAGNKYVVKTYNIFAPLVLAGIGDLPETVEDRSVLIKMRRKTKDETVSKFRRRTARQAGKQLRERIEAWASSPFIPAEVTENLPRLPEDLADRQEDMWEPLLWIAERAGEQDAPSAGDWPDAARTACAALCSEQSEDDAENSPARRLLIDCRTVFDTFDGGPQEWLLTTELMDELHLMEDAEWSVHEYGRYQFTAVRLAAMLKDYGIKPHKLPRAVDHDQRRGYCRIDFEDMWNSYVPASVTNHEGEED